MTKAKAKAQIAESYLKARHTLHFYKNLKECYKNADHKEKIAYSEGKVEILYKLFCDIYGSDIMNYINKNKEIFEVN